MIELNEVSFRYREAEPLVLDRLSLNILPGQLVLVTGPTGSGKSTLLKAINGLAPSFTGGTLSGSISVNGIDVTGLKPHDLADRIGYVNQQPEGAFVTDTVEEDLAYGMEQLGYPREEMQRAVVSIAERLGLSHLLDRPLSYLSGGQQQRVAIGSAIAAGQKIILLDEPTSALDEETAREVISLLLDLVKVDGFTVILSEHRIERVLTSADLVLEMQTDGSLTVIPPAKLHLAESAESAEPAARQPKPQNQTAPLLDIEELTVNYGPVVALEPTSFQLHSGQVLAVQGENGSGKTTLLWATLEKANQAGKSVAMVPQVASDLLFLSTVAEELAESDRYSKQVESTTALLLEKMVGKVGQLTHPRDLSAGQQLALVLAVQLVKGAEIILMDEPTRGLDNQAKNALADLIRQLAADGAAIIVASHDGQFLHHIADETLHLGVAK